MIRAFFLSSFFGLFVLASDVMLIAFLALSLVAGAPPAFPSIGIVDEKVWSEKVPLHTRASAVMPV